MNKSAIMILCIAALLLNVNALKAQDQAVSVSFSLQEARDFALENSPVLLNSARDVEIAKKMVWERTSTGLPQANISSSYSYTPKLAGLSEVLTGGEGGDTTGGPGGGFLPPDFDPDVLKTTFNATLQVNQLIFSGQYLVGLKAARVYANLAEITDNKSQIGMIENVTDTYMAVLVAQQSKITLDSSYRALQQTLYETEQMYENGLVESTDVDQIRISASNIQIALLETERQIEITKRLLKFIIGVPIDQPIVLTDEIVPLIEQMNLEASVMDTFDLNRNVDYRMLNTQEQLMKLNMQSEKAAFLPTLSGFYNRHEDFTENFFAQSSPHMFGLSLSIPLWSSGQRLSRVDQTRLEYLKAQTNKEMAEESLQIDYETAYSAFKNAQSQYEVQKENRNLSWRIYQNALIRYRQGAGSSLDLNQTQNQYFQAEAAYFGAIMSLVSAKSSLETLLSSGVL